jgi:hypothetical protein
MSLMFFENFRDIKKAAKTQPFLYKNNLHKYVFSE